MSGRGIVANSKRELLFSVTLSDCKLDTFTVGGHGGSGKDTSNTGVRITHIPSGAVGEGRESRSQLQNKRAAWKRMGESRAFRAWARTRAAQLAGEKPIDEWVEEMLAPGLLRVEVKDEEGRWISEN